MQNSTDISISSDPVISTVNVTDDLALGQWFWVKSENAAPWLGCVMHIGSNYVKLRSVSSGRDSYSSCRVHFKNFFATLTPCRDADRVLAEKVSEAQGRVTDLMARVADITRRLGLVDTAKLSALGESSTGTSLQVLNQSSDLQSYEGQLVQARDADLPQLFKDIKVANQALANWMSAGTLPLMAQVGEMEGFRGQIDDRIFNISLYAGLAETAERVADGEPASADCKLHVMQRRLYMDEECLANYSAGGMEFGDIASFDRWLAIPENRDRIFPFPRTLVAMQVRRKEKERDHGSLLQSFISFNLAQMDKKTFLYLRNGDQLYRIDTELDFGEKIFPDKNYYDPSEEMMAYRFASRVEKFITRREYESQVESKRLYHEWQEKHPDQKRGDLDNPYRSACYFEPNRWEPVSPDSVYYDDCMATIAAEVKQFNRIALIIQGLFDRSQALHPHAGVQMWKPDQFASGVTLVYDGSHVLHDGDTPDVEAYFNRCNASLKAGSVVYGQQLFWMEHEAEKENRRNQGRWGYRDHHHYSTYEPFGNPGPGRVAQIAKLHPGARKATFTWYRERVGRDSWRGGAIKTSISVPFDRLFNISAYQKGDYKQFFQDPRTRADYLKWAPQLLTAEEYLAGNIMPQQAV